MPERRRLVSRRDEPEVSHAPKTVRAWPAACLVATDNAGCWCGGYWSGSAWSFGDGALSLSDGSAYSGDRPHEAWLTKPMLTSDIVRSDTIAKHRTLRASGTFSRYGVG